jgi:hypothetical protein
MLGRQGFTCLNTHRAEKKWVVQDGKASASAKPFVCLMFVLSTVTRELMQSRLTTQTKIKGLFCLWVLALRYTMRNTPVFLHRTA